MAAIWNFDQAAKLGQYQELASKALTATETLVKATKFTVNPASVYKTSVLPNRNRLAMKHITLYQDKRLFRDWQRKFRDEWRTAAFAVGIHKKEGKTIYDNRVDIKPGLLNNTAMVNMNKDCAKAYLMMTILQPILEGLGEPISHYWTSAGFSTLIGRKTRRRHKKHKHRRHRRGHKKRVHVKRHTRRRRRPLKGKQRRQMARLKRRHHRR